MIKKLGAFLAVVGIVGFAAAFATPAQAATHTLYPAQSCLPDGTVRVQFSWAGNNTGASQQWLDLSLYNNNWQWGTFLGAGPMAGSQTSLTWDGLIPNSTHFVRVNQQVGNNWDPSPTFYFQTINCTPYTPPTTPPPVNNERTRVEAPIDDLEVDMISSSVYHLLVEAGLPGGCAQPDSYTVDKEAQLISVKVYNNEPTDNRPCTLIYGSYDLTINLGDLVEGEKYYILVNDEIISYTP